MNELIDNLNGADESNRVYAAQDIADTGDNSYVLPLVEQLLRENSLIVKDAIISSLCCLDCMQTFITLYSFLQSRDAYLRNHAVIIFVSQKDNAVSYLTDKFESADNEVKKLILDILFEIGSDKAASAIRSYLNITSDNVQIAVIEYLGRLKDTACIEDMVTLLQTSREPMLCTAILSAFININDKNTIIRVLSILKEDESIFNNNLYLPQILRLSVLVGNCNEIIKALLSVTDIYIYAEDIVSAIEDAKHRFTDIVKESKLRDLLFIIAKSADVDVEIRIHAADLLILASDNNNMEDHYIFQLGCLFLNHNDLQVTGVRLLAIDGSCDAMSSIQTFIKSTRNDELRNLCSDILIEKG